MEIASIHTNEVSDLFHKQDLSSLLGKRVRVVLDHFDTRHVVVEGVFLGYGDGGEFEIEGEDGLVYHAWSRLHVEEV